jgi:hypothetical protein
MGRKLGLMMMASALGRALQIASRIVNHNMLAVFWPMPETRAKHAAVRYSSC